MKTIYDVAIVGAGLGGLTLANLCADNGLNVILFEKNTFPHHKMCGEYISGESIPLLAHFGMNIHEFPCIHSLTISAPDGTSIHKELKQNAIGISRYFVDDFLAKRAKSKGVLVLENTKVLSALKREDLYEIELGQKEKIVSKILIGAFGKRSNLDVQLKRAFVSANNRSKNYVAVKYHVALDFPENKIELHNFENGYCGISRVENNITCICYLTTAENLANSHGDIQEMEKEILCKNPHLKNYFSSAKFLWDKPLVIAQVNFSSKPTAEKNWLMCGDSAGMIAPLCGNGMSIAMHAAVLLSHELKAFFRNEISYGTLEKNYSKIHKNTFSKRLFLGRKIQSTFGNPTLTKAVILILKRIPFLCDWLISKTHGNVYWKN